MFSFFLISWAPHLSSMETNLFLKHKKLLSNPKIHYLGTGYWCPINWFSYGINTDWACLSPDFISVDLICVDLGNCRSCRPILSQTWPNLNFLKGTRAMLCLCLEGFRNPAEALASSCHLCSFQNGSYGQKKLMPSKAWGNCLWASECLKWH